MSTQAPAPLPIDRARPLYAGAKSSNAPVGETIRNLIRKGRQVVKQESVRWHENRSFYEGQQWLRAAPGAANLSRLNHAGQLPERPGYNTYNQLRKNVKARVALLTKERPAFEVQPEDNDPDSLEASRFAEKFVSARWGPDAWDVAGAIMRLAKYGDIDGLAWLCVEWDPDKADSIDQPLAVRADGTPITDRHEYEALKAQDPEAQTLWRIIRQNRPIGDVTWRVVLPAALSVDPFAVNHYEDANWICETRVRPRSEVERRMGKSFKQAVEESNAAISESAGNVQYEDLAIGDGSGKTMMNETDGVVVHYFYARPCPDFPKGARVEILDRAPATPLRAEEWEDELPYFCYVTDEDPGHFIRSKGVVDDLKPIQRDYNQTRRYLGLWKFKIAYAPLLTPVGSLRGQSFWNEEMTAEVHMANGQPFQYQTPAEPTAVFTQDLMGMKQEMEDISGVSAAARGFTVPNAPESSAGINQQIQQVEHNLSEAESNLKRVLEQGMSRSLKLVERHYTRARAVTGVGVDDANEFKSFSGQMIRGAHRFRITSSMMPKSKAAQMAAIKELAPIIGGENLTAYLPQLIDGDPTDLKRDVDESRKHQRDEIQDLLGMVTNPMAREVYTRFEEDKKAFAEAMNVAGQQAAQIASQQQAQHAQLETAAAAVQAADETGGGDKDSAPATPLQPPAPMPPPSPMDLLASRGILPPNFTQSLLAAGLEIPTVEPEDDVHPIELKACNSFRLGDAYKRTDPMFKQLLREHMAAHREGFRNQMQAMAQQSPMGQQQGSNPNPKGTPSPPKNTPTGG